jgi:hypothetical protein
MTDHELLELAAKAAGIGRTAWDYEHTRSLGFMVTKKSMWNPLEDDGEALRLAVKLRLSISTPTMGVRYGERAFVESQDRSRGVYANCGDDALDKTDPLAATRRAIVRAAAAIGESMP